MNDNRILIISDIGCGPPYMGNRIRMRSLLKEIRKAGYQIHFAGIHLSDKEKRSVLPFIDEWVQNFFREKVKNKNPLWNLYPTIVKKIFNRRFTNYSQEKNHQGIDSLFDPIWEDQILKIQEYKNYKRILVPYIYNSKFLDFFNSDTLKIIDTHDVFTDRNKKLKKNQIEDLWFSVSEADEKKAILRANRIIAIQNKEKEYFSKLVGDKVLVKTVSHFINYKPVSVDSEPVTRFGFMGSDNPLNVDGLNWFFDRIFPKVLERIPDAELVIAGSVCKKIPEKHLCKQMGFVEHVEEFYSLCSFTINPIKVGTGLKIKTIESIAHGVPVIGTSYSAEGLEAFIGNGITVCKNEDEFIDEMINHLKNSFKELKTEEMSRLIQQMNQKSRENLHSLLQY